MAFSPTTLEQIRSRISLSELVSSRVPLKRKGRSHWGLCPFHNEKTPSFQVKEEDGFYYCFGCNKGGDIFKWLQDTQGLSFPEAVEQLAGKAGVVLEKATPATARKHEHHRELYRAVEWARDFYRGMLHSPSGKVARRYLQQRGIDERTAERFALGYAPLDSASFLKHMAAKGLGIELLRKAGVVYEDKARFRGRLIFPICDQRDRPIAFGARLLDSRASSTAPKYLNSPETELFTKGRLLYNFSAARTAARATKSEIPPLLVEGYMDAIALSQAEFPCTTASLGTALSEEQLALLWRIGSAPILCFDGDRAGQAAGERALERALPLLSEERTLRFLFMPQGEDPDSLLQRYGKTLFARALVQAESASDFLWRSECARYLATDSHGNWLGSSEKLAALEKVLQQRLERMSAPILSKHYRALFRDKLFHLRRSQRLPRRTNASPFPSVLQDETRLKRLLQSKLLVALANHPQLLHKYEGMLSREHFLDGLDQARQAILHKWNDLPETADARQELWNSCLETLAPFAQSAEFMRTALSREADPVEADSYCEQIFDALTVQRMKTDIARAPHDAHRQKRCWSDEARKIVHARHSSL